MSLGMLQPQQLICTVERGSVSMVEVWFVGGRGTDANPLQVEVLGDLDVEAAHRVVASLTRLMETHGPYLDLDLSGVDRLEADGFVVLSGLRARATSWAGCVRLTNPPPIVRHCTAGTSRHPTIDHEDAPPTMGPSMPSPQPFVSTTVNGTAEGTTEVLHLHGELDSDNAADLESELRAGLDRRAGDVVIDLGDVSFIDSTIISCLVRLQAEISRGGDRLTLRNPTRPVRRVLEITGLLEVFGVD